MNSSTEPGSSQTGISGDWVGVYLYGGRHQNTPPAKFTAAFTVEDAATSFTGVITDADEIGMATVRGKLAGDTLQFTKTYHRSRFVRIWPIYYDGKFSRDRQTVQGTWRINARLFGFISLYTEGTWKMQRPNLPEIQIVWPPAPQASEG